MGIACASQALQAYLAQDIAQGSSLKSFRLNTDSESKSELWIASSSMEAVGKAPGKPFAKV